VLTIGTVPSVGIGGWSVRTAVATAVAVVGGAILPFDARRDVASRLALGFLGVAALSAVVSPAPLASLLGPHGWFTGVVPVFVIVGLWTVGRHAPSEARRSFATGLILGGALNGVAALFQALQILPLTIPDSFQFGRSSGLMTNPVHLAALLAGCLALTCRRYVEDTSWMLGVAIVSIVMGLNLAGGRAGLASAVAGGALALRSGTLRNLLAVLSCAFLGVALSFAVANPDSLGSARVTTVSASGRPGAWHAGVEGALDRPILGWGPGRFEAVSTPRRSLASRRAEIAPFVDAHNWPIEYVATTGFLGLAILLAWLISAGAKATGGLALFALVVAANGLVEPSFVGVAGGAAFAFGASTLESGLPRAPVGVRRAAWIASGVAVMVALVFLYSEVERAHTDSSPAGLRAFRRATAVMPASPELLEEGAQAEFQAGHHDEAERLMRRAIRLEPGLAANRLALATVLLAAGDVQGAGSAYEEALMLDPWSVPAMRGIASTLGRDDPELARRTCARLAMVKPKAACGPSAGGR
jgi:hypothetical protein